MTISPLAASANSAAHAHAGHSPNPAQQARAADPTAKGAAFGALVSQFAKAKHAPVTPPTTDPAVTPTTTTTDTTTTAPATDTTTTATTTAPTTDTSTTSIVV
jgi:hypothetical protein